MFFFLEIIPDRVCFPGAENLEECTCNLSSFTVSFFTFACVLSLEKQKCLDMFEDFKANLPLCFSHLTKVGLARFKRFILLLSSSLASRKRTLMQYLSKG